MTVGELREQLAKYPADLRVVVPGYEDGYDDIARFESIKLKEYQPAAWYYGRYDEVDGDGEPAVLLLRLPPVDKG